MNKIIPFFLALLLVWSGYLIYNKTIIAISDLEKTFFNQANISFKLTKLKIENYLDSLHSKITIESYKESDNLRKIFQSPDQSEDIFKDLKLKLLNNLDHVYQSTLTDEQGDIVINDFDDLLGESCKSDLSTFSQTNQFNIRLHPHIEQYHFDIMAHYTDPQKMFQGVFFTSFKTDHISSILKQGETQAVKLYLVLNKTPSLIEITSEGNREKLGLNIHLDKEQLNNIYIKDTIKNTAWQLVSIVPDHYLADKNKQLILYGLLEAITLYLVSSILIFMVYKHFIKRKKALIEVCNMSKRYQLFLEKTDIGFILFNKKGDIQVTNKASAKLSGNIYSKNNQLPVSEWLCPIIWKNISAIIDKVDEDGQYLGLKLEKEMDTCDNRHINKMILIFDIILDTSYEENHYALFCKDMTYFYEIEQLNAEKQSIIKKLVKADTAKSEFLSHMSHELRTPLNCIMGFSQYAAYDKKLSNETHEQFQLIYNSGLHLLDLVNSLLDLSGIKTHQLEISLKNISLEHIINEAIVSITPLLKEKQIQLNYPKNISYRVNTDPMRLKQILIYLLDNAIKYNKNNGQVSVRYDVRPDQFLRINIIDTGKGISLDKQTLLFQPFTKIYGLNSVDGAGIGLSIVKQLITLLDGQVGLTSQEDQGSTFWIDIPLA
ncbi:MAG: hypothetical protein KAI02_02605 [Gammaproteobacteria bacterium]|nr:hypothetical protein [Gammaproteobacteria bacterium]